MSDKIKLSICVMIFTLGLVNFALYFISAIYLGGDAINGKIVDGHYFLMSHGRYTEVSAGISNYSKWHVYSTWVTHPLAFAAGFWYWRIKRAGRTACPGGQTDEHDGGSRDVENHQAQGANRRRSDRRRPARADR